MDPSRNCTLHNISDENTKVYIRKKSISESRWRAWQPYGAGSLAAMTNEDRVRQKIQAECSVLRLARSCPVLRIALGSLAVPIES